MKISLDHDLFQTAIPLLECIESHGYEAYFVGGCVRDTLLGKSISDIDIATSAFPQEIQDIFPKHFDVGLEHGTIVVLFHDQSFEVTTFRTESTYTDYRRPDKVEFVRGLKEDTLRRDFTINSMALDASGKLFDYHQGEEDLRAQLIRCVGRPKDRFGEDALRMMRAVRFAAQLGFEIEAETYQAMQDLAANLQHISVERIRIEFDKMMRGKFFVPVIDRILQSGLLNYLPIYSDSDYQKALKYLANDLGTSQQQSEIVAWSLLVIGLNIQPESQDYKRFMKAWTHSNQLTQSVEEFIIGRSICLAGQLDLWKVYQLRPAIRMELIQYFRVLGQNSLSDQLQALEQALVIQDRQGLALNGKVLLDHLSLKQGGPFIGEILGHLEEAVVRQTLVNDQEILLKEAERLYLDLES